MVPTTNEPAAQRAIALVVGADRRNHGAVLRAAALASLGNVELRVIVCARASERTPPRRDARVTWPLRETLGWIAALIPDVPVETRVGAPTRVGLEAAADPCTELLVMGEADVERADQVVAIAAETGTPVLVARRTGARPAVLAATDLEDVRMPVLFAARRLAATTDSDLFAVHNVPRAIVSPLSPYGHPIELETAPDVNARRTQLEHALEGLSPEGHALVCSVADTARLVVDVADALHVDAVVVGGRRRSKLRTVLSPSVPEQVVKHARTSVLVAPMGGPPPAFA